MDIKAPSGKVVSFEGFVRKQAAAYETRVASNASAPEGHHIQPKDRELRAARALGLVERTPHAAQRAVVLDMAYGAVAGQVGALLAQGKDVEAFGLALAHAVEKSPLRTSAPLVDDSHTFRMP